MYTDAQKRSHIFDLQTFLRRIQQAEGSAAPLVPDGIFGAQTAAAVREYQQQHCLPVTGIADQRTWNAIYASYAALIAADALPMQTAFFPPESDTVLKPISGGGGLAMGSEIIRRCGPDSYAGRVAAVMLGASETSLYTISVYSGHLGLNRTRYAVFAALCGDVAAFTASAALVRLYFPYS